MRKFFTLMMMFLLLLSLVAGQPAPAAEEKKDAPGDEVNPEAPLDKMTAADVEAFLDGIVPQQLALDDIAGATVVVVKNGQVLFSKGYGYADVEKKKPVSPDDTLFRPGSISKLFTWTAVMQMYEQGKVDLDKDINEYLDFKIPEAFGKPITLKNLMTHTPGFEESIKDLFTHSDKPEDLAAFLKTHIPARIYPPGTVPAYSNYGTNLAGYIVQRVSGTPFNEYVEKNILKPLGMTHSSFVQPLPKDLEPLMSKGYSVASDEPRPFEIINHVPAGALSSSASDMAKFMLAHLQNGKLGDAQILKPETAELMHSRLFALDDDVLAMCYGFYEETRNGHRIIGHGGDTIAFHSDLHLVLDQGVGFFVSYNSGGQGKTQGRAGLWHAFLDRYYPYENKAVKAPATAEKDAQEVSGSYKISRRPEHSLFYSLTLFGETTVSPAKDGAIEVSSLTGANTKPKTWEPIGNKKYREKDGQDVIVFKPDASGNMQILIPYPFMIYQKVGLWENFKLMMPVLVVSLVLMLLTLVLWPVSWLVRRHYGKKLELTRTEWWLRVGVRLVFALDILFVSLAVGLVLYALSKFALLDDAGVKWFMMAQVVGVLGSLGTLVVIYNAVHTWMNKNRSIWMKLQGTLFVLLSLGLLWFVFAGNLLRFTSHF